MEKTEPVIVKGTRKRATKRKRQRWGSRPKGGSKRKSQKLPNIFQECWLLQDEYKGWLVPVSDNAFQAKCIACNQKFECGDIENKAHSDRIDHSENVKAFYVSKNIVEGITSDEDIKVFWRRRDRTQVLEDRVSSLITKYKWNMRTAKSLFALLEAVCDDPEMIADVSLERFTRGAVVVEDRDSDEIDVEF